VTSPIESLQDFVLKWFVFDSHSNVIASPYLKPDLGVDGDFSIFFWESLYLPITTVQRAWSILRLAVWRTGNNGGCPILWDDPELTVLKYTPFPPGPFSRDVPSLRHLNGATSRPIKLLSVVPCPSHVHGGYCNAVAPHQSSGGWSTTTLPCQHGGYFSPIPSVSVPTYCHFPTPLSKPQPCTIICPCLAPPNRLPKAIQGNPSSTSLSFLVIPDEGSVVTMLDTGCPKSAMNRMVLNMTDPSVAFHSFFGGIA
jgi:hypothetical protein